MKRVLSIDIGKKNFCLYIEEFDSKEMTKIQNIPSKQRYNVDGTPTEGMQEILNGVFTNGRTILHSNLDLTEGCDKGVSLDPQTFFNMNDALDELEDEIEACDTILIEQQMNFGKGRRNNMAIKLAQHCYSYFTITFGPAKELIEFPAYHKTQVLGAPKVRGKTGKWKSMEKKDRKKWSVETAIEILMTRGEVEILDNLTAVSKKDDLADTLTQLQAYKYLKYVDKKPI